MVRRSPHVLLHWRGSALLVRNYATGISVKGNPLVCALLDFCQTWRSQDEIANALPFLRGHRGAGLVRRLTQQSLLHRSDRKPLPAEQAMAALDRWNPEAGFFHTATKDVRFWSPLEAHRRARIHLTEVPIPAAVKRVRGTPLIRLPKPQRDLPFGQVAVARRTWRRFSSTPPTAAHLGTVLGLACGVQKWARAVGGEAPLKTSPSGGARHPVEAYVVVRQVVGVSPGLYHYAADRHALCKIRGPISPARLRSYVPNSGYFARASVMVLFTAVFERQVWRYPYSRAYRAALIEAGHVCQTFLLAATALELAPFCLMGLADSVIERDLGIDGLGESVLYAAGFGRRPRGASSAPLPRGQLAIRRNPHL